MKAPSFCWNRSDHQSTLEAIEKAISGIQDFDWDEAPGGCKHWSMTTKFLIQMKNEVELFIQYKNSPTLDQFNFSLSASLFNKGVNSAIRIFGSSGITPW